MNEARFERFDDLCKIDLDDERQLAVSIARCRTPTSLPLRLDMVERHPLGSQAFVPLSPCKMVVVVAPPEESVDTSALRAFVTNGRQGINYHRGTWHMPLIAFEAGQKFLIIDRRMGEPNCDMHMLDDPILLESV
jgi:ureidoglycolate lyase